MKNKLKILLGFLILSTPISMAHGQENDLTKELDRATMRAQGIPVPTITTPSSELEYARGHDELEKGWHFIYGPMNVPDKSARLYAQGRNGTVILSCNSNGMSEIMIGIAGVTTDTGKDETFNVSISDVTHPLTLRAIRTPEKEKETQYYGSGTDVIGLIDTMVRQEGDKPNLHGFQITSQERTLTLPLPWPAGQALQMSELCSFWHNKHVESITH